MNFAQKFITFALSINAIELIPSGRALKSGRVSPYFFNAGLFKDGKSITELASAYAEAILTNYASGSVSVLFGPAYKGIPLATAVSMALWLDQGANVDWAFNRKEKKDHGEGGVIVGNDLWKQKVLIIDDVITSGETSGEAVEMVQKHGGELVGYVIAFDRQEFGLESDLSAVQQFAHNRGIPVVAVATLADLIAVLQTKNCTVHNRAEMLDKILAYRERYGVGV
ncbi:MAG: hypothetical protein ACD_76C00130G0002 [uncultured bacterium]|nr:MAG: hypothetical protein ACD_76C00130G0002 [uncultured bacterium]